MKRRDLFRQAMNQHLPDRKNILNTILTEAPASAPRHIGGKRALAAVLATVLLVACGTLYYFWGKPHERQPQIIESAELRLFAAGNTAVPESATELEPNIEFQMPMWGSWLDEDTSVIPADSSTLKQQRSALGIRGESLQSYTISCDNGRLVYCPETYSTLLKETANAGEEPSASRYMSYIFLPEKVPFQEAFAHAQRGNSAYFEQILKDESYQFLRDRYFDGAAISLDGASLSVLQTDSGRAVLSALRAGWEKDPLPQSSGQSITVLRPQESAGINWEPSTEDYRKFYESGPFSYADFGSATITVHAQFQGGKEVEKHLFVYFSEDGYQTYKLLD